MTEREQQLFEALEAERDALRQLVGASYQQIQRARSRIAELDARVLHLEGESALFRATATEHRPALVGLVSQGLVSLNSARLGVDGEAPRVPGEVPPGDRLEID